MSLPGSVGGLIIAGSYVPKTTAQLEVLRKRGGDRLITIELNVKKMLEFEESAKTVIEDAATRAEQEIPNGRDVLIMTSRELVTGEDEASSLDIGSKVAEALVNFLTSLKVKPRYIISKV